MQIDSKTTLLAKILTVLLVPIALYWQDLNIIFNEALNSDLSTHILIIPFLLIYMIYRIRKPIIASTLNNLTTPIKPRNFPIDEITGTLLCLLAYLIKWYGSYTFQPLEYHIASLPLFVVGIILVIFNSKTLRILLFPIAFLAFLIPPPVETAQAAGSYLATISSQIAYSILKSIGLPVSLLNVYGSPIIYLKTPSGLEIPFAIDIACSGLYSLIGFIVFAVFVAYIVRASYQKKIAILVIGFPLIYALNILRITLIVIIGKYFGQTLALNVFHLIGGWTLILVGTLILFIMAERALNIKIFGLESETCLHSNKNKDLTFCLDCGQLLKTTENNITKMDVIKITLIFIITISQMFLQVPVFALTEGPAEVFIYNPSGVYAKTEILPEIEGYTLRFVYRDIEFEQISGQNASLSFQYIPESLYERIIWVSIEIGHTKGCLHPWEVCLITWPQTHGGTVGVTQLDLRDIHLLDNPPLSARYFVFQEKDSNTTQVVLYWYTRSIFQTANGYQQKWTKLSVIQFTQNPQEYRTIEDELLPVAKAIANHWQPISNWSWISLAMAKNGQTMIISNMAFLTGFVIMYLYFDVKMKNSAEKTYSEISDPEDRNIIDSIKSLEKEIATETRIALKYEEITGKGINQDRLHQKLMEAEKSNIIKRSIANINDEPYITWKLNFPNKLNLNFLLK